MGRACSTYGGKKKCTQGFGEETSEGMRKLERPGRKREVNIKRHLLEVGRWAWTGSIWLRIGTGGGLL